MKGAINDIPKWYRFGYLKLFAMIVVSLSLGAYASKSMAEFLEDNEIFIPEDDD
jgi:hypothetical protein